MRIFNIMKKAPEIRIDGVRVASVDKKRAALYIGCPQLIERMLWAARHQTWNPWIEIVHNEAGNPKSKTLISATSLESAYLRIQAGEEPPRIGESEVMEFEANGRRYAIGPCGSMEKYCSTATR